MPPTGRTCVHTQQKRWWSYITWYKLTYTAHSIEVKYDWTTCACPYTRTQTYMHTQHKTYIHICTYMQAQYCTNLLSYTQIHIHTVNTHGTYSNMYMHPHPYTYVRMYIHTHTCTPTVLPEHLAHYTPQALLFTFPVSDISPVMANSCRTGSPWASDSRADTMVQPALGPSLGVAPWSRGRVRVTPAQLHNTG